MEQHWSNIIRNDICIPTHEILVGNENESVQYRKTLFLSDKMESKMLNYVQSSQCHLPFVDDRDKKEEIEKDLTDFILSSEPVTTALNPGHQDFEYDYPAICPGVTSSPKDQQLPQLKFGTSDVNVQTTATSRCESSPINNTIMQNNEDSKPSTSSKANTFLTKEAQAIYKVLKGNIRKYRKNVLQIQENTGQKM